MPAGRHKSQSEEIQKLLVLGCTQQFVANQYGVHQATISRIKLSKIVRFRKE